MEQLERSHTNAGGREGREGNRLLLLFFSLGGGRQIIITSCNSWKDATPTLGGRERGGGQSIIITFFFSGGGQSIIITFFLFGGGRR